MAFLSADARAALYRLNAVESAEHPSALDRLAAVRVLVEVLDADPAALAAVREARASGQSWESIAEAANLSVSAAKYRWAGTDAEIDERHESSRRRKRGRPSSVPSDLPGLSVAAAATRLGVTAQAIYLRIRRGQLEARTVELPDGRRYKRVFLDTSPPE